MALSRREFVRRFSAGSAAAASAAYIIGYGREGAMAFAEAPWQALAAQAPAPGSMAGLLRLASNENLRGPSAKVLEVLRQHPSRGLGIGYPPPNVALFQQALAEVYGAKPENVLMATGSDAILQAAVYAYGTESRSVVTADPSYGTPVATARRLKVPVKVVPVLKSLQMDLEAMVGAAIGSGLAFICNPNNPTSAVSSLADVEAAVRLIKQRSPETGVLIDEAYIDYATAPGVGTMAKVAMELPGVFITRTFSKAFGMAGLRMGYAIGQPETLRKLSASWGLGSINELQAVAGIAAVKDTAHMEWERNENKRVRDWTQAQFKSWGFDSPDSQTNFIFVNIRRPAVEFRDGCRAKGIAVGRDFPPMEKTYARISLGRMEDMERALPVFKQVLGV